MWMVLMSMLLKKMEEVIHKMKNGVDAYKHVDEVVDREHGRQVNQ